MHINLNIINDKGVSVNKGQKYYEHFFPQALEEVKDTKSDAFSPAKTHGEYHHRSEYACSSLTLNLKRSRQSVSDNFMGGKKWN